MNLSALEHIGIAVENPEAVAALYEKLLGAGPYKAETVRAQGVRTHFIDARTAKLELLESVAEDSPVARFLEKKGEGLHHLAFEVDDVEAAFERAKELGLRPLSDAPSPGADGKRIFFLHPKDTHGVLIELCEGVSALPEPARVPYRGGHLAVYAWGRRGRPAVLLLHGAAGTTATETEALARRLEPRFHVLALDFAGHGASSAFPETEFTADLFADNARAALDHFEVETAHVFGFSMGGYMALHFARRHPERVGRLAVHGACLRWDAALVERMTARLDAEAIAEERPRLAQLLERVHADWPALFRRTARFVRTLPAHSEAMEAAAREIAHETLVSAVDRDDLFPLSAPLRLHAALPDARLALVPGGRHAFQDVDLGLYAPLLAKHFGEAAR